MLIIKIFKVIFLSLYLCSVIILFSCSVVNAEDATKTDSLNFDTTQARTSPVLVYKMVIDGPIGAVTAERVGDAVKIAEDNNAELLVIFLDTPGGFTKPTWTICKQILNSSVPVCVYIAPSGARAGSAGVYITYSANFAAMAPSTNIGAAHPVAGSGQKIDSVMNEKITNDAVAQIKAAAEKRGRNAQWAEDAVRHSVSIPDKEALKLNVINFRAKNMADLLAQIDGKITDVPSGEKTMSLKKYRVVEVKPTFIQKFLEIITSPDIAFILMSIGGLGVLLELYNPGSILPGVVGVISLVLAFYAFQTLPINYAGLSLIILAVILFIAEIKIVSHGLLTIGGLISFFFGGLMLINTSDPNLQISKSILITVVACIGIIVSIASWLVIKASRRKPFIGNEEMVGKIAEVRSKDLAYIDGALWKIQCDEELVKGDQVEILAVNKLTLKVKKLKS
ncbi:MAG: nodulation protein NfeD [FCB group bacterium]|nr:nodulation protein NfeD [FCB group bacterium]